MKRIAILGANGQVGTETSLYLSKFENIEVVPICRTNFAASFLNFCGLKCRIGNIGNPIEAAQLLADCDLITDFTYLKGLPSEIKKQANQIITNAISFSSKHSKFVYISSIMAYGMGKHNLEFKNYLFARSVYGAMKRYGENLSCKLGKLFKKEIYILRLGEVHGELQSVSKKYTEEIKNEPAYLSNMPSYTIFPFTIAEALVNIAHNKEKTGLYTLISTPEWKWEDVYKYYCERLNIKPRIILIQSKKHPKFSFSLLKNFITKVAVYFSEPIANYLLAYFPKLEKRLMAKFYIQKAKNQINSDEINSKYFPFSNIHKGKILGKRLTSLTDTRKQIKTLQAIIQQLINNSQEKILSHL